MWYCEQAGTPAPLDFRVALYEEDGIGGFPSCFGHTLPAAHECGDDLIGDELVHYSTEELLAALPNPGDTLTEGLTFEPCDPICHFEPPKYRVYWRVTRVADAPAAPSVPSAPGNLPGTDGPTTHAPED